jgi:hypothetical protein
VLTLAPDGLLSGSLKLRIVGANELPGLVDAINPGSGKDVAKMIAGASLFMKTSKDADGRDTREIMLSVRNGRVAAGLIPLARIPPIHF